MEKETTQHSLLKHELVKEMMIDRNTIIWFIAIGTKSNELE